MQDFTGKVALVTGGASGIGLAIAKAFAAEGTKIALVDIDPARLSAAAKDIAKLGVEVLPLNFDVTDFAAWSAAKLQIEQGLGPVSILCNNAGVGDMGSKVEDIDVTRWRWFFSVNLDAHLFAIKTFLPDMKSSGAPGQIVTTVSISGLVAVGHSGAYQATKFAAMALAQTLREELRGTAIGICAICPGLVATQLAVTSDALIPNRADADDRRATIHKDIVQQGMRPEKIAASVIAAVKSGKFYVLTHPDWKPLLEKTVSEQLDAFETADPSYHEDLSFLPS